MKCSRHEVRNKVSYKISCGVAGNFNAPDQISDCEKVTCDWCDGVVPVNFYALHLESYCPVIRSHKSRASVKSDFCESCDAEKHLMRDMKKKVKHHSTMFSSCVPYFQHFQHQECHLKDYVCERCILIFPSSDGLKLHKLMHVQEDQKFEEMVPLLQHSENIVKKYVCKSCGAAFERRFLLEQHMLNHEGKPSEGPFFCKCGATFKRKKHVRRHSLKHKEKSFFCTICGQAFFRRDYLNTHMQRHSFDYPYSCEICKCRYKSKPALNYHKKKKHTSACTI